MAWPPLIRPRKAYRPSSSPPVWPDDDDCYQQPHRGYPISQLIPAETLKKLKELKATRRT